MGKRLTLALTFLFTSFACFLFSDQPSSTIFCEELAIQKEKPFWLLLHFEMPPSWHIYWKNPGSSGLSPHIDWDLPEGYKIIKSEWSTPSLFKMGEEAFIGYEREADLLFCVQPPALSSESLLSIKANLSYLACSESTCELKKETLKIDLPLKDERGEKNPLALSLFEKARVRLPKKDLPGTLSQGEKPILRVPFQLDEALFFPEEGKATEVAFQKKIDSSTLTLKEGMKGLLSLKGKEHRLAYEIDLSHQELKVPSHSLGWILLLAFLGGFILNGMPCVLPVVSFKILSFIKMCKESRREIFKQGLYFSFGVILSFWILAFLLLALQAYGKAVGWGFQLQAPLFVAFLSAILFLFSLNLFGLFEFGLGLSSLAGQSLSKHSQGTMASFFSGMLATAVATPCTGPFLGTAVGFAIAAPPFQAFAIFTFLGLGLSSPYLLVGAFPSLLRFIPKPGAWMETFKQLLGFVMLATVIWLLWVFGAETSTLALLMMLIALLFLSLAAWIFGKWATPSVKRPQRLLAFAFTLLFLSFGLVISFKATRLPQVAIEELTHGGSDWEPYSPKRLEELRAKGIPVFIDFTAKWCLICQTNHFVLSSKAVDHTFSKLGVVRMKADWTKNDPLVTEALKAFGRSSVPLYIFYGKDQKDPDILPQVLTPDIVMNELQSKNAFLSSVQEEQSESPLE